MSKSLDRKVCARNGECVQENFTEFDKQKNTQVPALIQFNWMRHGRIQNVPFITDYNRKPVTNPGEINVKAWKNFIRHILKFEMINEVIDLQDSW